MKKTTTKKGMTEKELHTKVCRLFRDHGWVVYSIPRSQHGGPGRAGFPDLIMHRNGHVMAIELKTDTGTVKLEQHAWMDALMNYIPVYVVRPTKDWDTGFVHAMVKMGEEECLHT